MSYYNNLISLPVLFLLALIAGEFKTLLSSYDLTSLPGIRSVSVVSLSCVLGFSLSISAFALNKRISATSMMVANNVNKFVVILLSETFVQRTLDMTASAGALFVLFLGWLYSQSAKHFSKMVFVIAAVIFTFLVAAFEYERLYISMNTFVSNSQANFPMNGLVITKFHGIIDKEKPQGKDIYRSYLPLSTASRPRHVMRPGILIKNTTYSELPKTCLNRNASIWRTCDPPRCRAKANTLKLDYPRTTKHGEKTGEFINRVLEEAWGPNPPSVDLYLRSGCVGIVEMKYLFESIEIFWPRFLGSVVVALDAGDETILNELLPSNPTHHYVIAFENVPCMKPRVFNQYSYLNLDRHCTSDYVVTIDSDCVFHTPVTPDLIFRHGKVILASSRTFQRNMWTSSVDLMLGVGLYDGHYMVTQPVTFALSSFSSFRQWFYKSKGICYEDRIAEISPKRHANFCWMCQLGTFLERGGPIRSEIEKYWFHHLDNSTVEPILRYSTHVTHEPYNVPPPVRSPVVYEKSCNEVVKQGLCRAFGSLIFPMCVNYSNLTYVNLVTFLYAHVEIQVANETARINVLNSYLKRLSSATTTVLEKSTVSGSYL